MKNYKRKLRNEKIKKVLFIALFVLIVIQALWTSTHYSKSGMVWEVNNTRITVRLANGEMCSVSTNKKFKMYEKVNVVFDTMGTHETEDDTIINVK